MEQEEIPFEIHRYDDDKEIRIKPLTGAEFLHPGQFFFYNIVEKADWSRLTPEGPTMVKIPLGVCGFVITLPTEIKRIKLKDGRPLKNSTRYTQLNYVFLQCERAEFDPKNKQFIIKPEYRIIPLDGQHHEDLLATIGRTTETSSTYPELPVSWDFIEEFRKHEIKPVDPVELYQRLITKISEYVDTTEDNIKVVALWTIGTYFYQLFDAYPFLFFYGLWQSGKTKMLTLLSLLSFLGCMDIDVSESSFFRMAEDFGMTLLIDETEYLREGETAKALKKLIYARYKKTGGYVQRVEGDKHKYVRNFKIYGPLAIASVRDVDPLIADRSIRIVLWRGKDREKMKKWPQKEDPEFQELRDDLYRLMLQYWKKVDQYYRELSDGWLVGREWELWRPLAAIAKLVGEEDIQRISETMSQQKQKMMLTEKIELVVLKALAQIVTEDGWYSNRKIREVLVDGLDEDEKNEMRKILSAKKLGEVISSFGFERRRTGSGYEYFLQREKVLDLAERWGISIEQRSLEEGQVEGQEEDDEAEETEAGGVCELCGRIAMKAYKVKGHYVCEYCLDDAYSL